MLKLTKKKISAFYRSENGVTLEFNSFSSRDAKALGTSNYALMRSFADPEKPTFDELKSLGQNTLSAVAGHLKKVDGIDLDGDTSEIFIESKSEAESILEQLIGSEECSDLDVWIDIFSKGQKKT